MTSCEVPQSLKGIGSDLTAIKPHEYKTIPIKKFDENIILFYEYIFFCLKLITKGLLQIQRVIIFLITIFTKIFKIIYILVFKFLNKIVRSRGIFI